MEIVKLQFEDKCPFRKEPRKVDSGLSSKSNVSPRFDRILIGIDIELRTSLAQM